MQRFAYLALVALGACGDEDAPADHADAGRDAGRDAAAADGGADGGCESDGSGQGEVLGLRVGGSCSCGSAVLLPRVLVDGVWLGGGDDGTCSVGAGGEVVCPARDGQVSARLDGDALDVRFTAGDEAVVVGGLELAGDAMIPGATTWFSNGLQSWSQSGAISLGPPAPEEDLAEALVTRGDGEVLRGGRELSWWFTAVGGGGCTLVAGAVSAERFHPWAQAGLDAAGGIALRVASGGAGEQVAVGAGQSIDAETWRVEIGDDAAALLERYGRALPSRRSATPVAAEAGWNSWYELWDGVDEEAVLQNALLAREVLGPRLPQGTPLRIVVDDGWEVSWGEWEPNEKFPSGLDGLAADLHDQGFEVGVWLAPLLVDAQSSLVAEHPDWFVGGASYSVFGEGELRILDPTSPEAAEHLAGVIRRLVAWGYDFLKIDFLFAGAYEGHRAQPVTGLEAYRRALSVIREAAGEDVVLLAVGAPGPPSFPMVDGWRFGGDIVLPLFGPSWPFVANVARSLSVRFPLCFATLCDADPPILRTLERDEVEAGGWIVALSGGALFLSDDLRLLDADRPGWILDEERVALPLGGMPSIPEDPFGIDAPEELVSAIADEMAGQTRHLVPLVWRAPDGARIAWNASDEEATVGDVVVPPHAARVLGP
ncbi:MAG: alpha-galactosidase [Deltaproteobacteria bacterium]|nr:alpha-galactosidase [Deltaproteobacteria bacterium]